MRWSVGFLFFSLVTYSFASTEPVYLVKDTTKNTPIVKHWRIAKQLWASGSAVPSEAGFKTIKENILTATHHQVKTIIDLDLRQENHGYLNKNAIELEGYNNWANLNKTREQVLQDEQTWSDHLRKEKIINNVLSAKQYKLGNFDSGHSVKVKSVEDEKTVVEKLGFTYVRLTVPDHKAPSNSDVDRFVALVRTLKPNTWLHIHCRGGDGRTTTFMAMYDMLTHKQISYNDMVVRQASIAPYYNLVKSSKHHAKSFAERTQFLEKFHQYAQAYANGYTGSWSNWLIANKKTFR